jgi:putative ABC transport system permease protein
VAATVGVGIMIGSFRASVSDWLEHTLTSDIYIATDDSGGAGTGALPPLACTSVCWRCPASRP